MTFFLFLLHRAFVALARFLVPVVGRKLLNDVCRFECFLLMGYSTFVFLMFLGVSRFFDRLF